MKKQITFNIIIFIGLLLLGTFQIFKKEKTVYVEIGKIMQEYEGMKDARKEYEKKATLWQANGDTLVTQWQEELKDYEKEHSKMTKKERELKEEVLLNKQQQINQYREAIKLKMQEEDQLLTQSVVNAINDYLKEYGKAKGYTYILGANGSGNIAYADKSRDVTEKVIEGLNKEYNGGI